MASNGSASFERHFQDLADPRIARARKHPLINIVFMAVCGILSGSDSIAGIHEFAIDRRDWFARFLDLSQGVPCEDTFARVLARIDPAALERCLLSWIEAVHQVTDHRLMAIDGKTLRGSEDQEKGRSAIPMVSAWAVENQLSLGQVVVQEKSNEITAIPALLEFLEISGALITIDAMGCQTEIADRIRQGGGDYILAVKANQPKLYEQVERAIDRALEDDADQVDEPMTDETGHGRIETRTYAVVPAPEAVDPDRRWRDLKAVGIAISEREDSLGRARIETRYYILSQLLPVKAFARAVRGHWGIENNLHWQLDMSFGEDECRVSRDHAPANLSVIRRFALGLLKRDKSCRKGIAIKRLKCAANDEYREEVLFTCGT
jgi:predicted transposase YbfD/YdcC